jgi:hypothetical protein
MPFKKGNKFGRKFPKGRSANPGGRPSKNAWLSDRGTPPEACPEARNRLFDAKWFALHLRACSKCRAVVRSLALILMR